MAKLNANKVALTLGCFAAVMVLLWSIVLAIGGAGLAGYWLRVHFISGVAFQAVTLGTAVTSIIHHFVVGAIIGWLFATVWNNVHK